MTVINLDRLERDSEWGAVVNMLRAYRKAARALYNAHQKQHCTKNCCREVERLEGLFAIHTIEAKEK